MLVSTDNRHNTTHRGFKLLLMKKITSQTRVSNQYAKDDLLLQKVHVLNLHQIRALEILHVKYFDLD